jgi:hypothetical protein
MGFFITGNNKQLYASTRVPKPALCFATPVKHQCNQESILLPVPAYAIDIPLRSYYLRREEFCSYINTIIIKDYYIKYISFTYSQAL